jgi:hypothetical protein
MAAAWFVLTHVAYADSANNAGKKAADVNTNNAANKRSGFILVSLP